VKEPNSNKLGFRVGKCIIHRFPKRSFIHLFCLSDQRNDSSFRSSSIPLNFGLIKTEKKDRPYFDQQNIISTSLQHPLSKFKKVSSKTKEDQLLLSSNSLFWLNSPIQQKKQALIHLFKASPHSFSSVLHNHNTPDKRDKKAANLTEDFFLEHKEKYSIIQKNPIKFISENKKFWNKKYNFQFSFTDFQSVSKTLDILKNQFLHTKSCFYGPAGQNKHTNRVYFNFYTMHYYFMKKMNIFDVDVYNTKKVMELKRNKNSSSPKIHRIEAQKEMKQQIRPASANREADFFIHDNQITQFFFDSEFKTKKKVCVTKFDFNKMTRSLNFSLSNIRNILSLTTNTSISLRPLKVHSIFHSATLVAQEVACKLEQKKSFRLICRLIFQQLMDHPSIKGIRITCSGRMNGAEIAKTECKKFGETSLHVFSDKIDYAQTIASTSYGILGVKVWISFI